MKDIIITHDGKKVVKGMRVAYSDLTGFLYMGTVIGFKNGLAKVELDSGSVIVKEGVSLYSRER